jgi:osmotically-inducible protein OsmY
MTSPQVSSRPSTQERPQDTDLQRDITAELDRSSTVDSSRIGVSVEDGVCHLDGQVENVAEDEDARKAARRVHGVVAFVDRLHPSPAHETAEPGSADS